VDEKLSYAYEIGVQVLQNTVGKNGAYYFQSFAVYIKFDASHETKGKEVVSWSGYK
jgi:hypothetical protein